MKKITNFLFFVCLLVLFLLGGVACRKEDYDKVLNQAKRELEVCCIDGDNLDNITNNVVLKKDLTTKVDGKDCYVLITWESRNENIISCDGKVSIPDSDISVSLIATLDYKGHTKTKDFTLTVKGEEDELLELEETVSLILPSNVISDQKEIDFGDDHYTTNAMSYVDSSNVPDTNAKNYNFVRWEVNNTNIGDIYNYPIRENVTFVGIFTKKDDSELAMNDSKIKGRFSPNDNVDYTDYYSSQSYQKPKNIVVTPGSDPRVSMKFNWCYDGYSIAQNLYIAKSFDMQDGFRQVKARQSGIYCKAEISDLEPNTEYYYHVGNWNNSYNTLSDKGTFRTAGNLTESFSFIHYTDTQNLDETEAWYGADTLRRALEEAPNASFVVHTGDIVETPNDQEWCQILQKSKDSLLRTIFVPTQGNHDRDGYYDNLNVEWYYSFTYNSLHMVVLNSQYMNDMANGEQRRWLEQDIKNARANGAKWVVLSFHKALFSVSYHSIEDSDISSTRQTLMYLADQLDVDLVLNGHDHTLARTKPLRYDYYSQGNAYASNNPDRYGNYYNNEDGNFGTIFVLPNTAGTKVYPAEHTTYNHLLALRESFGSGRDSQTQHFVTYDVNYDSLTVKVWMVANGYYGRSTSLVEQFTIYKPNSSLEEPDYTIPGDEPTYNINYELEYNDFQNTPVNKRLSDKVYEEIYKRCPRTINAGKRVELDSIPEIEMQHQEGTFLYWFEWERKTLYDINSDITVKLKIFYKQLF